MAVQAQCPSNILFRNVQEGKNTNALGNNNNNNNDYTLQPRGGGGGDGGVAGFITNQSHVILNNGVGMNPRKRIRETVGTASQISPFSFPNQNQPAQNQIIDLSQIHGSQPNVVSTGLRLAYGNQQQQLHHHHQHQHQLQQSMSTQNSVLFSLLSEELAAQIEQQRDDIDNFLQAQAEQLRRTLAEKRQRHYRALLSAAEETLARKMREKDVEKAVRRHAELEARAAQVGAETQLWQARAKAQEAAAISLQAQLQQVMMKQQRCNAPPPGCSAEKTACEGQGAPAEDAESAYIDPDRVVVTGSGGSGPTCKACRKRVASVVLLPCRHLCLCPACDVMAESCPLCSTFRSSSVEVFLS